MRVLLTGAGGFVGHHVLEHLLVNTDWAVTATDSFRHRGQSERITDVLDGHPDRERVRVIYHDLRAPFSETAIQRMGHLDAILNLASESSVDRSITDPTTFIRNNVDVALSVAELARRLNPHVVIHVSTDEVYGPALRGHLHREWSPIVPSNPYSASKAAQEAIMVAYWRTYGVPLILTNTMNIIGERQDSEKYLPMLISRISRGESVDVHASADGKPGSRFYLHARNQADALLHLTRKVLAGEPLGWGSVRYESGAEFPPRYNIVGEREMDNLELAVLVAKHLDASIDVNLVDFHTSRPGHDLRYALDGARMEGEGWLPPVPLEESIRRTVDWTMAHPEWIGQT